MEKDIKKFFNYLKKRDLEGSKIIFFTTSNRWEEHKETPKSSQLALDLRDKLTNCEVIDVSKLKIFTCEGNVSSDKGNGCGLKSALLKDDKKNPHKFIRCWASINNPTDEMYVVANKIYEADIVVFFGSIRWGKMNATYTHLIERFLIQ
jgi:multimeric flavodoxin WrbA